MSPVNRSCEQNGDLSVTGIPSDDDSSTDLKNGTQKNRPQDTRLRQQKLSAWQPILTATSVIPTIFVIGIVFVPIGVALFLASASVQEIQIDYTKCPTPSPSSCRMKFVLDKPFEGNVYFYYGLDNYFQNLRRYMKSRSDSQLIGDLYNVGDCAPYAYLNSSGQRKVIAPCGAAANSMFNDTFKLYRADGMTLVPWTYKGIVWPVDKERKFKNPPGATLKEAFANTVKPPNWGKEVWELDPSDPDNNGFMNADFIVWMRTAALPDFRKLYRILLRNGSYSNGLENGTYILDIRSNYPVTVFGGRKSFIISTTSWAGGKNPFLGIVYMTVGSICIVVGCVFLLIHQKFGTRRSEITETYFSRRHEQ